MQIVGFMEDEVQSVLELVAAVLKLGNLEFKPESRVNGFDESRVKDKNGEHFIQWKSFVHPPVFASAVGSMQIIFRQKNLIKLFYLLEEGSHV